MGRGFLGEAVPENRQPAHSEGSTYNLRVTYSDPQMPENGALIHLSGSAVVRSSVYAHAAAVGQTPGTSGSDQ